jgi:hypothetical protein
LLQFVFQPLNPLDSVGVSALPIPHFATKLTDLAAQCPQFLLHSSQGRAVRAGNRRFLRLARKLQERGIQRATLYPDCLSQARSVSTPIDGLAEGLRHSVKLRPTRQRGELPGSGSAPTGGRWSDEEVEDKPVIGNVTRYRRRLESWLAWPMPHDVRPKDSRARMAECLRELFRRTPHNFPGTTSATLAD